MEKFQVVAYKSKKGGKFYLTMLCAFFFLLFPIAIHLRQIFESILFGAIGLSCLIYLVVKKLEPKEKIEISENTVQLNYLRKTIIIELIKIEGMHYEPVTILKRHVPIPETYGSLTIYTQDKKYYIDDVEDVKEVYEVLLAYVNNKKELRWKN